MHVKIRNPKDHPLTLSGFGTLGPGEEKEVPENVARRYERSIEVVTETHEELSPFQLSITCSFHPTDGYGIGSGYLAKELLKRNYALSYEYPQHERKLVAKFAPELIPVMDRRIVPAPRVGIARSIPSAFSRNPSKIRFGWTMFEAAKLPREWVEQCNKMDYLIVPAKGIESVFTSSGVNVPVYVIPEPLNLDDYPATSRKSLDNPFTFVSLSRMCDRKCPVETVECFLKAFPKEKDVRLVMKTRDHQFGDSSGILDFGDDRIKIIDEDWTHAQVVDLLHQADAGVFLSHGEGFYQGPVQAMATGLPVILPDHSGCSDYANGRFNYPVSLNKKTPIVRTDYFQKKGISDEPLDWFLLDYDQVVDQMRDIYKNREKAVTKGERAATWIRNKFNLETTINSLEKKVKPLL